jgi:hypothetical protein
LFALGHSLTYDSVVVSLALKLLFQEGDPYYRQAKGMTDAPPSLPHQRQYHFPQALVHLNFGDFMFGHYRFLEIKYL